MNNREFLYHVLKEYAERNPYIRYADVEHRFYTDDFGKQINVIVTTESVMDFAVAEIKQMRKEVADLEFTIRKMMKVGNA